MKPFLTAEWRNVVILTYAVDPDFLVSFLPKGLELDTIDDKAFVSFVAFDFLNTRVKRIPVPFHINFPEINLRFYVKYNGVRGVTFIKELVPKKCIAHVARKLYNEPYEATKMSSESRILSHQLKVNHTFNYGEQDHSLEFLAENKPFHPESDSLENFFKEHEWGFGTSHSGRLMKYKVEHPEWRIYPIKTRFKLDIDFKIVYGLSWEFLNMKIPYSVLIAEGSKIKIFPGENA